MKLTDLNGHDMKVRDDDPIDLYNHAFIVVSGLPTRAEGLGTGLLERTLIGLTEARTSWDKLLDLLPPGSDQIPAELFSAPPPNPTTFERPALMARGEALKDLQEGMESARIRLGRPLGARDLALPPGVLCLGETERAALKEKPGIDARLEEGWVQPDPSSPLLRHPSGAWLRPFRLGTPERLYEGPDALACEFSVLWRVSAVEQIGETLLEHTDLESFAGALGRAGFGLSPVARLDGGNERALQLAILQEPGEPPRRGLLWLVLANNGQILGHGLLEGAEAFDQLVRLSIFGLRAAPPWAQAMAASLSQAFQQAIDAERLPELLARFAPRAGDLEAAFAPGLVEILRPYAAELWVEGPPQLDLPGLPVEIEVELAVAGSFSMLPRKSSFAGAWKFMDPACNSGRIWATLRIRSPGAADGLRVDGFVWLEDHWAWIPKPWRHVPESLLSN